MLPHEKFYDNNKSSIQREDRWKQNLEHQQRTKWILLKDPNSYVEMLFAIKNHDYDKSPISEDLPEQIKRESRLIDEEINTMVMFQILLQFKDDNLKKPTRKVVQRLL